MPQPLVIHLKKLKKKIIEGFATVDCVRPQMYTDFFIKLFFNQLTSKESTDSYDEGTKHHAKRGWPASS